MSFNLVAIDLGKKSFHLQGVSSDGVVLSKKIGHTELLAGLACALQRCYGGLPQRPLSGTVFSRGGLSGAPNPALC